ncbi:PorT family protein [Weeksellaceae bacterium TAE3-ERU29]|nr:PorT family protein [Weeksellaceae bacterium TAE3-ERU29]
MKRLLSILSLFTLLSVNAQWKVNYDKEDLFIQEDEKRLSWGYFIGLNQFNFKIEPKYDYGEGKRNTEFAPAIDEKGKFLVTSEPRIGFTAGLMGKLRINDYFDVWLQPGIQLTERILHFENLEYDSRVSDNEANATRKIKSSYVDVPIFIQLHGDRWFNTRPYIQAGVGYAYNIESQEKSEEDNSGGTFRMIANNFNWQAEAGISIYFRRFKLTPSIKGIFFLNDELVPDKDDSPSVWANSMSSLKTRAVVFSLKFE